MQYIADCHCDTLGLLSENDFFAHDTSTNINYHKLKRGNVLLQVFAVCTPGENAYRRGIVLIDRYKALCKCNDVILPVESAEDINQLCHDNRLGVMLALEGADVLEGDIEKLNEMYRHGVRMLTVTWNNSNPFCGGIGEDKEGLSPLGEELVKRCNELGIIIDVSHISNKGFWDVAEISCRPFIASHSNAKALCNHKRNLTDEQMKAIAKADGIVGINYYPPFLNSSGEATVDDVIRHIEYMAGLIGTEHIALGSDFDGTDGVLPKGLSSPEDVQKIPERLLKLNYSDEQVEAICWINVKKSLEKVGKVSKMHKIRL